MEVTPAAQSGVQQTSSSQEESESSKEVRVEGNSVVESSSTSSRSVSQSVTQKVMSSSMVKQSSFSSTTVSSSQQNSDGPAAQPQNNAMPESACAWRPQDERETPCQPPQQQHSATWQPPQLNGSWQPPPPQQDLPSESDRPQPAANEQTAPAPAKDCSDLPQDDIKSTLKEIIYDLERADLTDSVGDLEVADSSLSYNNLTTAEKSTKSETAEERRKKMDRQTSTTTLEQTLLKEHQIAHELNMVLNRTEEPAGKEGIAEEENMNHIPDDDRSRGGPAHIDLERLFTPATDSGESTPKRSKSRIFASSSFYGPEHPTVEEQVELARRISSSLSDVSNQRSKGQTMYVNRKKRSTGWVHQATDEANASVPNTPVPDVGPPGPEKYKPVLKLVMDPRGQVQDLWSLQKQGAGFGVDPSCGALSPEVCFHLVRDLNAPKGKGAELFAKRRKKSEKWVVDETTVRSSSSMTSSMESTSPAPKLPIPAPSYLTNGTSKVHTVQKMNEIQEKFSQPRLKLVKSPWEVALETGSVDGAFLETPTLSGKASTPAPTFPPAPPLRTPATGTPTWTATTTAATVRPLSMSDASLYSARTPRGWGQQGSSPHYGDSALLSFRGPPEEPAPLLLQEARGPGPAQTAAPEPPPRTVFLDYSHLQNYNTAPRGWGTSMDYYRPVTFSKPIAATDL